MVRGECARQNLLSVIVVSVDIAVMRRGWGRDMRGPNSGRVRGRGLRTPDKGDGGSRGRSSSTDDVEGRDFRICN